MCLILMGGLYHLMLVMCTLYCVSIAAMQRKGQMKITQFVVGSICHWMAYLVKYSCLCLPVCRSVFVRLCICICECEYRAEGEGGQLKMRECGGDRLAREVTLPGRRNSQIWSTMPANIWSTIPDHLSGGKFWRNHTIEAKIFLEFNSRSNLLALQYPWRRKDRYCG